MRNFFRRLGQRNAHKDIVFFCIMWVTFAPICFILTIGVAPAIIFWVVVCTMIVVDVEWGYGGLTLTP